MSPRAGESGTDVGTGKGGYVTVNGRSFAMRLPDNYDKNKPYYGGGMSYAIACGRAKVFRAVAIYEGAVLSGCTGGNDPIAYWQMAGTTDNTCSIGGATLENCNEARRARAEGVLRGCIRNGVRAL